MTGWDYVIVGGGSAGSVVAARLSECSSLRVLLLEAGLDWRAGDAPDAVRRPELWSELMLDPQHSNWHWSNVLARRTSAQEFRPYRQGLGLGGSSVINGMVALRPPLSDFDDWNLHGCVGWSSKEVLNSFIRLEDDPTFVDMPYHGVGGPIPIYRLHQSKWTALDRGFVDAAMVAGYSWRADQNCPDPSGVGCYPCNLRNGERVTANDAYLEATRSRQNLSILGHSLVDRVVFDKSGQTAIGVWFEHNGKSQLAECNEVILCAGAIQSPAILMRSGIGPADDLRRLGIRVIHDSPVGQRLQDHPMLTIALECDRFEALSAGPGHGVVLRFSSDCEEDQTSDLMVHPAYQNDRFSRSANLFVFLLRCYSRGVLRLVSNSPQAMPEIDLRLLSDDRDIANIHEAVRVAFDLASRPELMRIARTKTKLTAAPDSALLAEVSDAKHISCTSPMGHPDDEGVVVNPCGEVAGVSRLRIADMSIAPSVPKANTYLTAVMIGEHIAAMIQRQR